jgi:hypothetical protein
MTLPAHPRDLIRVTRSADLLRMRLLGAGKGGVLAIAAYRDRHFQGYALRTPDGWVCVCSLGMTWSKLRAQTAEDARMVLRTTSHAARFDDYRDVELLVAAINKMPPYQQPGILPRDIPGFPAKLPKLAS